MDDIREMAAALALTKLASDSWSKLAQEVRDRGGALPVLEERGYFQSSLFDDNESAESLIEQNADMLLELRQRGINTMVIGSPDFPTPVSELKSPPLFLFYRGTLNPEDHKGIAMIGSRRVPTKSLEIARSWSSEISRLGSVVVSGLAAGVDREAHLGALDAQGRTVAIVGTGIERSYPKENADLQEEIASKHLVVSQFLPDAPPSKVTFPMRNAVMAAWARATLVIDADERSGAAMQARLAVEQKREVFLHEQLRAQPWAKRFVDAGSAKFVSTPEDVIHRD